MTRDGDRLRELNQRFYDRIWSDARLVEAERFNSWPLVRPLAAAAARRLEVGPGLRPRLPSAATSFVDPSLPALSRLREAGGQVACGLVTALPFPDGVFDLVAAFDIVEHVEDDGSAFSELARVAAPGATLLLSVPLDPSAWTAFDAQAGHHRRYRPEQLLDRLQQAGFSVTRSAVFGMQPRSARLVSLGMWFLERQQTRAMWWYNRVFMPLGLRLAGRLRVKPGLVDLRGVDTVLLVCRRQPQAGLEAAAG